MARDRYLRPTFYHRLRAPDYPTPQRPLRRHIHGYHGVLRHVQREARVQLQGPVHGGSGASRLLELHYQCFKADETCKG